MPYKKAEDVPMTVRKALPAEGLSIWMGAFNAAHKKDPDEAAAAAIAWAAVKAAGFVRGKGGKWTKATKESVAPVQRMVLADEAVPVSQEPDSTEFDKNLRKEDLAPRFELWPFTSALSDTIRAIAKDTEQKEKLKACQRALSDFTSAVMDYLRKPPVMESAGRQQASAGNASIVEALESAWDEASTADGDTIPDVTIIRAGVNKAKSRKYTPEFLQQCVAEGRFSGSFCYLNHPTQQEQRERPERDLGLIAARTGDAYWDEASKSVKAPLVWLAEDVAGSKGQLGKAMFIDPVVRQRAGLSIFYQGDVKASEEKLAEAGGRKVVVPTALLSERKFDVDLVTSPGAGGGFPLLESTRGDEDGETPMSLEELKEQYPELVEAIRAEVVAEQAPAPAEQQEKPAKPVDESKPVDVDAVVREAIAEAVKGMKAEMLCASLLEAALSGADLGQKSKDRLRKDFDSKAFETEAAFREAFDGAVKELQEIEGSRAQGRVTGLSGEAAGEQNGETAKTLAEIIGGAEVKDNG